MTTNATPQRERRRKRSGRLQLALDFQLRHVRDLYGFDDVVLASEDGFIVSCAATASRADRLAALAPEMDQCPPTDQFLRGFVPEIGPDRISTERIEVNGQPLFVCITTQSTPDTRRAIEPAVARLETGVKRIFKNLGQAL